MTEIQGKLEVCDCNSHLIGPFQESPLSSRRSFDPPASPSEELETVSRTSGLFRAVFVQTSADGDDKAALLATLARSPETMRGVVLLQSGITQAVSDRMTWTGLALQDLSSQWGRLLQALAEDSSWVLTETYSDLEEAAQTMCIRLDATPEQCVWQLDWLPVNLARRRSAVQRTDLLIQAPGSDRNLERVFFRYPAELYCLGIEVA